jgi:hypothetical protein
MRHEMRPKPEHGSRTTGAGPQLAENTAAAAAAAADASEAAAMAEDVP